jgi:hypothetical protein
MRKKPSVSVSQEARDQMVGAHHLDTSRQCGKAISNIRGSPELGRVNDAVSQGTKLLSRHVT